MTLGKISVVSGQIDYPRLTSKMSEIEYAQAKAHVWLHMLNEGQNPKKWLKANTKGTKVNFDYIASQEEYDKGLIDLECYLAEINVRFGLDYKLTKEGNEGNAKKG